MKLARIVTHHEKPKTAAEIYYREGIIAIGFVYNKKAAFSNPEGVRKYFREEGDYSEQQVGLYTTTFLNFRDEIGEGDVVFAYAGSNRVALVGELKGKFQYDDKNVIGNPNGEWSYPNQWNVSWWKEPRNFDRAYLPTDLRNWVARPGTLLVREYSLAKLKKSLKDIPSQDIVSKALQIQNEKEIKDYIEDHIDTLEKGLILIKREYRINSDSMDFLAKDDQGTPVVIEVKVKATESAISQIRKYMRAYKKDQAVDSIRGIVVAQHFSKGFIDDMEDLREHNYDIKAIKCRKTFAFDSDRIIL